MGDFTRTLETAKDAEGIARLLLKAAERKRPMTYLEAERLRELSARYTDYAKSLRQMAGEAVASEPEPDQGSLLMGGVPAR